MSNAELNIRNKLIEQTNEWWKNKAFVAELKCSDRAMDNKTDKGITLAQLHQSIDKLRSRKYGT